MRALILLREDGLSANKLTTREVINKMVIINRCGDHQRFRRRCGAVIMGLALQSLCIVSGVHPASAPVEQSAGEIKRPALQIGNAVRYDEDWSVLRGVDRSKTDDFWDRLKFIPLTQDQTVWLSLGGQVRERVEYFNQFQWG